MNEDEQKRINDALARVEEMENSLLEKGEILVRMQINSKEGAAAFLDWFYGDKSPIDATLLGYAWNKKVISAQVYDALMQLKNKIDGPVL